LSKNTPPQSEAAAVVLSDSDSIVVRASDSIVTSDTFEDLYSCSSSSEDEDEE